MYIQPKKQQWLDYLVDKKDNATFSDATVINTEECKTLWIRGSVTTGVTCLLSLSGGLIPTALTKLALPSTQIIGYTSSAGTAVIATNDISLTSSFVGSFIIGIKDPPPFVRFDLNTATGGGGNGGGTGTGLNVAIWGTSL